MIQGNQLSESNLDDDASLSTFYFMLSCDHNLQRSTYIHVTLTFDLINFLGVNFLRTTCS